MGTLLGLLGPALWGIALALLVMSPVLLPIILRWLADREIFFARGKEGDYRAVTRNGKFRKGVVIYKDFKEYNGPEEERRGSIEEDKAVPTRFRKWWREQCGGIFPLWIPRVDEVYRYNFRWIKLYKVKPKETEDGYVNDAPLPNGQHAVSFEKELDYIYLRDANYFFLLKDAETAETIIDVDSKTKDQIKVGISVNIYAVVTLRILNPYKALFRVDNWLDVTLIAIESALRSWASKRTYLEVLRKKESLEHQRDKEFLTTLTEPDQGEQLVKYVLSRYGAQVKRIQFIEVELPAKFIEQVNLAEAAKKEAERIITLADARARQITATFDPILARGEAGIAVRALEALGEAGQSPSNWIITAGPGLVENLTKLASGVNIPKKGGGT